MCLRGLNAMTKESTSDLPQNLLCLSLLPDISIICACD